MNRKQASNCARADTAQNRVFYLCRLAAGYVLLVFALGLAISCELASIFAWAVTSDRNETAAMFAVLILMGCGGLGWWLVRSTIHNFSRIPYVPPVREQIAALAAESVLVRAFDAPGDGSELLRPGAQGERCKAEELLRPEAPISK